MFHNFLFFFKSAFVLSWKLLSAATQPFRFLTSLACPLHAGLRVKSPKILGQEDASLF